MNRVLLVDDHASFRQPLAFMLEREEDFTVAAQAGSLAEARAIINDGSTEIDIAVVDLMLPDGNGVDLIRDLREANPRGSVVVLSASADRIQTARAVEAGASGVLHKASPISEIIVDLRRVAEGAQLIPMSELIDLLRYAGQQREQERDAQQALGRLTPREREVLQALAEGLNDREIAGRLSISVETARTHMVNILGKLGVESRLQALIFALRHGVVRIE